MAHDRRHSRIPRQPQGCADLSLPGRVPIAAVDRVDERVRRERRAAAECGLAIPGLGEARQQRPAAGLAARRRELPGVVVAVGGDIRGDVHRR